MNCPGLYVLRIKPRFRTTLVIYGIVGVTCHFPINLPWIPDIGHAKPVQRLVAYRFARCVFNMVETLGSRPQPPGVGIYSFEIVLPLTVLIFEPFFPVDFCLTIVDHTAKPPRFP